MKAIQPALPSRVEKTLDAFAHAAITWGRNDDKPSFDAFSDALNTHRETIRHELDRANEDDDEWDAQHILSAHGGETAKELNG